MNARVEDLLDLLADALADRLADRLARRDDSEAPEPDDAWLTTAQAAQYLGLHRDTVRKLAAGRDLPCEQDAPGCKLYFRRAELDQWRASGGRVAHRARNG